MSKSLHLIELMPIRRRIETYAGKGLLEERQVVNSRGPVLGTYDDVVVIDLSVDEGKRNMETKVIFIYLYLYSFVFITNN